MLFMCVSLYPRDILHWHSASLPIDYNECYLCGPAQEVWEYLREQMMWYVEPTTFNPGLVSVRSWRRSGAIKLYQSKEA